MLAAHKPHPCRLRQRVEELDDGVLPQTCYGDLFCVVVRFAEDAPKGSSSLRALIFVGGDFNGTNSIGGQDRNRIAKLSATGTGSADETWNPNSGGGVGTLAIPPHGNTKAEPASGDHM